MVNDTSDAEEEEVHSEKLATPLAPHYFVKTEAELFWSFFRSRHRGMSGSSICLNLLLIAVRLPIYLNVSIAVSHVLSAAPLSGLPHRQITSSTCRFFYREKQLHHLHVDFSTVKNKTVSMYMYFHDGSLTFRNRFQNSSSRIAKQQWITAVVRAHHTNPKCKFCSLWLWIASFPDGNADITLCLFRHKCVSQPSYMAYHRISICNHYGTNVLVFQICNMVMQTATLPLTESNGKSIKRGKRISGKYKRKFSFRRCLRLRLRANKICILPLGYAKGVIMQILNCLGPQALPQATLQGK
ncbi:hypothetical protein T12_13595 [Trichinella patagoniensis]|uniref:Uncharacterized protein n=1 Tax=Trichinella patagoniensis TaxID=990121 RepID=A0A0V0ZYB2_9BILA|nr:hypothetical protein T12_13595 [Trichinella patagoniensis]